VDLARTWPILRRAAVKFYEDQMTQHAGALTYYALMSLFPALLLGLSLLGLLGEYPRTYDSIIAYVRQVAPDFAVATIDQSLRHALENKDKAATALVLSIAVALYGTTGVLEATRRALNVVFEVERGRGFLHRKALDIASTFALMTLVLVALMLVFVGGRFADDLLGFAGLGEDGARAWSLLRWPTAVLLVMLVFAWLYHVTPDVPRRFRWVTPGTVVGVLGWIGVSFAFSQYLSHFTSVSAVYGAFAGIIVLVGWLWLTAVALLFGAEIDAAAEKDAG